MSVVADATKTLFLMVFMVGVGFALGFYMANKEGYEQYERGANCVIVYHKDIGEGYPSLKLREIVYNSGKNPKTYEEIEAIVAAETEQ